MIWTVAVLRFAHAIAFAEGSNLTWNNPGDMKFADGFPTCGFGNTEGVLKFVNMADGWEALYHQCDLMLTGKSHEYALTDTLEEVGVKYSGGDTDWAKNVAWYFGVPVTTTLQGLSTWLDPAQST